MRSLAKAKGQDFAQQVEELFDFLKCAFGAVRITHRAAYALPMHLRDCLRAYSLYKSLLM